MSNRVIRNIATGVAFLGATFFGTGCKENNTTKNQNAQAIADSIAEENKYIKENAQLRAELSPTLSDSTKIRDSIDRAFINKEFQKLNSTTIQQTSRRVHQTTFMESQGRGAGGGN